MSLWKPRYTLCKLRAAGEVFISLLAVRHSTRSLPECVQESLGVYHDRLTSVIYLSGDAMCPSLNPAYPTNRDAVDTLLMRKIPLPSRRNVAVGDVVAFDSPYRYGEDMCWLVRRVCGMEGERLVSDNPAESFIIPPRHCWVMADNPKLEPPHVVDSRYFGPLPMENVRGRIIYNGYSRQDHGSVQNSSKATPTDGVVLESELDLDLMFPEGDAGRDR